MPAPDRRRKVPPVRLAALAVVAGFAGASLVGALLLYLPFATRDGMATSFIDAAFTAASAVCVTGLVVVDTQAHWSPFGQGVILALIQIGGFGIMTMASLIVVLLAKRLGLRHRLVASAESGSLAVGDIRRVLVGVARFSLATEAVAAVLLWLRFWLGHGEDLARAAQLGVFHSVSAFNNAGFSLFSDNLERFAGDPVVLGVVMLAVVIGGLGYPVWVEIARHPRHPASWGLHAKITVVATLGLLGSGALLFAWFEWTNPATLGSLSAGDSLMNALFHSAMPRTAGFNSMTVADLREPARLLTEVLMFIGGGSASTAGGIKVTTFALLGWVIWAEARGDYDVVAFERRVPESAQRQALTVALLAVGGVVMASIALMSVTGLARGDVFFESVSALGTVGLSTGITPLLSSTAKMIVIGLMLVGRVGPITLFVGLVLRQRARSYRYPVERPIIG